MKKIIFFFAVCAYSLFSYENAAGQNVYNLGNSAGNATWFKLGTLSLDQQGRDAYIKIISGNGYNASINQNSETIIHFRTSNGNSSDNGFYVSGSFYNTGIGISISQIRVIQNSTSSWDFYAFINMYSGDGATVEVTSSTGSWTPNFTLIGSTPPSTGVYKDLTNGLNFQSQVYFNQPVFLQQNVGIGTTTPGSFKLAVEGNIGARKVVVTKTSPFPDYVFNEEYNLQPLLQVEQFIKVNKHLPKIPSANEVEKNGLDVGDNQTLLLKKIEELTLYLIEIKKENEQLKSRIEKLEREQ